MTLITRSLVQNGTFAPSVVNILEQIPESALFFTAQRLRHPSSIYRLSLDKIEESFCRVVEGYLIKTEENREYSSASIHLNQLLKDLSDLLHVLQEHLDELWMILKTLIDPKSAIKTGEYNEKYVVENRLQGAKSFQDAIADYKRYLRIENKLKHQQCFLRGVAVWSRAGVHLGYCLEEPDDHGVLGPSNDIHPDQGAFSFARDLTWHLAHVYWCSEKLVKAVSRVLDSRGIADQDISSSNRK